MQALKNLGPAVLGNAAIKNVTTPRSTPRCRGAGGGDGSVRLAHPIGSIARRGGDIDLQWGGQRLPPPSLVRIGRPLTPSSRTGLVLRDNVPVDGPVGEGRQQRAAPWWWGRSTDP